MFSDYKVLDCLSVGVFELLYTSAIARVWVDPLDCHVNQVWRMVITVDVPFVVSVWAF